MRVPISVVRRRQASLVFYCDISGFLHHLKVPCEALQASPLFRFNRFDSDPGMIHRPYGLVGVGAAVIFLPSSHEGAERREALGRPWHLAVLRAV